MYFQAYDSGRVVLLFTFIWLKQDLLWEFLNKRGRSDNHLSQLDNKERHCDSKVFCQRTRPNDSDQGQDPDLLTQSLARQLPYQRRSICIANLKWPPS